MIACAWSGIMPAATDGFDTPLRDFIRGDYQSQIAGSSSTKV